LRVTTEFVTSAVDVSGFPKERLPELALAGRSNVGKSSLINALVKQKVARTSAAPGKTRLANFYRVAPEGVAPFYLVDLPGYGYARGGDQAAREFETITGAYFSQSGRIAGVFHLVDSRHPGLEADLLAARWLGTLPVPSIVVATKLDKLSRAERTRHLKELEQLHGSALGVSVQTGEGLKELWELIATRLRPIRSTKPQPPPPAPRTK
jgi:GTP-binding protein